MSLKKVGQIKQNKPFKVWDILIYGILAALIVALFLGVFITADTSALKGINIYYDNNLVFTYSFEDDDYTVYSERNISFEKEEEDEEEKKDENSLTVYFTTDDGSGHNTIYIDKSGSVKVTEADCSNRKDCVYTSAITNNSKTIVCSPHRLRIEPADYSDDIIHAG